MANTIEFIFEGKDEVSGPAGKVQQALGGLASLGAGIATAGFAALSAGALGAGIALKGSLEAAMESQDVMAQFEAVLESTGGGMKAFAGEILGGAEALSKITKFSDDAIMAGSNMLLTFTNIGEDVFPQTQKIMLDMSQALGQDLTQSAMQLGKALNDPVEGVSALRRVGVAFNEEQEKMIKNMVEAGDVEGAQVMILQELQKEFGGSAEAAGQTFGGQIERLKNTFGEMQETIGLALLPVLQELGTMFMEHLNRPEVQEFIQTLAQNIADFARNVVENIPVVIEWFKTAFGWLMDNKGVIVAALAVIGSALLAFGISTAIAAATAMAPLLPLIAVIAAIGAAAYLLYEAWTNNWGGIQEHVAALWAWLQPILQSLMTWLQTNIPIALQALSDYWNNVLLPSIRIVWEFIQTYLMPLFQALAELVGAVVKLAFTAFIGYIQNVTIPALKEMWKWFEQNILPTLRTVAAFLTSQLGPAWEGISNALQGVIGWIREVAAALNSVSLPWWLTPGSPTPFEMGLTGISNAMQGLSNVSSDTFVPGVGAGSPLGAGVGGVGGGIQVTINWSPTLSTASREDVERLMPLIREGALRAIKDTNK